MQLDRDGRSRNLTPTTRLQPDVIWLEKELTGANTDDFYYLTTLFQGLPEASRAYTAGKYGFLQQPSCNMVPSNSNPCILYWSSPSTTSNHDDSGELLLGISTDVSLETVKPNAVSRNHLQVIRNAYAEHGIKSVAEDNRNQIIGIAISCGEDDSITLTCPTQICDLVKIFFSSNEAIPLT